MSFLIPVSTIDYLFSKLNLNTTNYSSADKLNKLKELGKLNSSFDYKVSDNIVKHKLLYRFKELEHSIRKQFLKKYLLF